MEANSYAKYEDAGQKYLERLNALMQLLQNPASMAFQNGDNVHASSYIELSDEIADISATMIGLALDYLKDPDIAVQEGLFCHFLDQATAELLMETELLQLLREEQTGIPPGAAIQATHSAALREAINSVEKSMAMPVRQGFAMGASYRIAEAASVAEASSSFQVAFGSTAGGISRRVQELGSDIAMDLIAGTEWTSVAQGAASLKSTAQNFLEGINRNDGSLASRAAYTSGKLLLNVYEKIAALANGSMAMEMREKIGEWIQRIAQTGEIELFSDLVEKLYGLDALGRSIERSLQNCATDPESLNRASDAIKTCSDKFIVLTGRMRKFEDAIRLGKLVQLPQLLPTVIALQMQVLASLVFAGRDYINRCEESCRIWRASGA
jgi:hypothetical protein